MLIFLFSIFLALCYRKDPHGNKDDCQSAFCVLSVFKNNYIFILMLNKSFYIFLLFICKCALLFGENIHIYTYIAIGKGPNDKKLQ